MQLCGGGKNTVVLLLLLYSGVDIRLTVPTQSPQSRRQFRYCSVHSPALFLGNKIKCACSLARMCVTHAARRRASYSRSPQMIYSIGPSEERRRNKNAPETVPHMFCSRTRRTLSVSGEPPPPSVVSASVAGPVLLHHSLGKPPFPPTRSRPRTGLLSDGHPRRFHDR